MRETTQALAFVRKELEKRVQEQNEFLAAGRADSFDEYKKICGVIRGLSLADQVVTDLVHKLEHSDD